MCDNFIKQYSNFIKNKRETAVPAYFINLAAKLLVNGVKIEDLFNLINNEDVIYNLPPDCLEFIRLLSSNKLDSKLQKYVDDYITHGKKDEIIKYNAEPSSHEILSLMLVNFIAHERGL
jgi:hypothetical protein